LCVDCSRELWQGLVERKIAYFNDDFIESLFIDWSNWFVRRDAAPVQYWIQIGLRITIFAGCLGVAIFGWWHPNS
jgi:hypothetical protein